MIELISSASWWEWTIVVVVFFWVCLTLINLSGLFDWPCANPKCKKGLPHAYYISGFCPDCIHMDAKIAADPTVPHRRNLAAYGQGEWP